MIRKALVRIRSAAIESRLLSALVVTPYLFAKGLAFSTSSDYWDKRYSRGGTSGPGSRGMLAMYKAKVINDFVERHDVTTVVELGCGDGHQLGLLDVDTYLGVDVSPQAIALCRERFADDASKGFELLDRYRPARAFDLALSLDVIFHLVEDEVFEDYMATLFASASRYVVVYSSDRDTQDAAQEPHVRHRAYSTWIRENAPEWSVLDHVPNPHAFQGDWTSGSFASFTAFARG